MTLLFTFLIGLVAFEHFYFLILEMFLWTKPKGIKTFGLKNKEYAEETKVLAAGLVWSLLIQETHVSIFFLICVVVAGIYGAYSTKKIKLFYIQSLPAIFAIIISLINQA